MNSRLNPPKYGNLYYSMIQLKKKLKKFIGETQKDELQIMLDFGCGSQPYKNLILENNFKYIGADLHFIENIDIVINEDGILNLADESVDVVLSSQVLEHIYDYNKYLKECNRVLKPNGYLILSTHGHWQFHPDPNDYWRWTSQGLKKVVLDNGFKVEKFEGIMNMISVSIQYFQDHFRNKLKFKVLITAFTYFTQGLIRVIERRSPSPNTDAGIFIFKARKQVDL